MAPLLEGPDHADVGPTPGRPAAQGQPHTPVRMPEPEERHPAMIGQRLAAGKGRACPPYVGGAPQASGTRARPPASSSSAKASGSMGRPNR